jgi:hypothetical protein
MVNLHHASENCYVRVFTPRGKQLFSPIDWRRAVIVTERDD